MAEIFIFFFWAIFNVGLLLAIPNYKWLLILFIVSVWAFIKQFITEFKKMRNTYISMTTVHLREFKINNWNIFIDDIKNFDNKSLKKKHNLSDKDLDLEYWYNFIENQAVNDAKILADKKLDSLNSEYKKTNSLRLSDNIFGHAQEYINKHVDSEINFIKTFASMRIISFGVIYEKLLDYENRMLSNDFDIGDKIFQHGPAFSNLYSFPTFLNLDGYVAFKLLLTHAKARLYGAIKFALISGIEKKQISDWYSNFEDDKELIKGTDGLQRGILETINSNAKEGQDLDFVKKMKIIYDEEERFEIFELSKSERKKAPHWFKGPFYKKGGIVTSIFTNNSFKLNSIEKSIFSEVQFYSLLIEKCSNNFTREDFSKIPPLVNMVTTVDAGNLWFESNNKEAYKKLFLEDYSEESKKDNPILDNVTNYISIDNNMPDDAEKIGVKWSDTEDVGIVTNYKGKPYSGVCYSIHENGGLEQYYFMKNGLKDGIGKGFSEKGDLIYWGLYKDDIRSCAIWFENGKKIQDCIYDEEGKEVLKRAFTDDKFLVSSAGNKPFAFTYDEVKSEKLDDYEELLNMNRGLGFSMMKHGLIDFYTKDSPYEWIEDVLVEKKDDKYYVNLHHNEKSKPQLVNGVVYDLHFDGSIRATVLIKNGLIEDEIIQYDIRKF